LAILFVCGFVIIAVAPVEDYTDEQGLVVRAGHCAKRLGAVDFANLESLQGRITMHRIRYGRFQLAVILPIAADLAPTPGISTS